MSIPELKFRTYMRDNAVQPTKMVILLHGYGSNADDMLSLGTEFAQELQDAIFISPHAPFPCEMGGFGYQWYSLADYSVPKLVAGARIAQPILHQFIEARLKEHKLDYNQLAIGGFSQGCMMSLFWGLRATKPVAGILGYSGLLVGQDTLQDEITVKPPVCLVHGRLDPVVPYRQMEIAEDRLTDLKVPVEAHTRDHLMHSIDFEGIDIGVRFLQRVLG